MKKAISLILALVLCLSLCACGGGDQKIETQGADADSTRGTVNNSEESTTIGTSADNEYVNHPLYKKMFGTWEPINHDAENDPVEIPYNTLTVNEDHTCVIDGVAGTWDYGTMYGNDTSALEIDIFINGERTCGAIVQDDSLMPVAENYAFCGTTYFNTSSTIIVEITPENWLDYFELVTEPQYDKNAFGDVERLQLIQYLSLKEEYVQKFIGTDVVSEISSTAYRYPITLNVENESYTLGDIIEEEELAPQICKLSWDCTIEVFGNNYIDAADNADQTSESSKAVILVPSIENIKMLRIQGTILLAND